jgi:PAS domain S-box-containing protein
VRPLILHLVHNGLRREQRTAHLRTAGFRVEEVQTGSDFLSSLEQLHPDIIWLDSGFELPSRMTVFDVLEADARLRRVPVLLVIEAGNEGLLARSTAFLTEPVDERILVPVFRSLQGMESATFEPQQAPDGDPCRPTLPESAPCIVTDAGLRIANVNSAAEALCEVRRDELVGRKLAEAELPLTGVSIEEQCHRVRQTGEPARFQAFDKRHGRWLEATACAAGAGFAVYFGDIPRPDRALTELQSRWMRLFDSSIIGMATATEQGVQYANDEFLRIIGFDRCDLYAGVVDWQKVTPPEHLAKDLRATQELAKRGQCTPFDKEYVRPDGTRVPVLAGAVTLSYNPLEWVAFVLDISSQKAAEAALKDHEQRLELATEAAGLAIWELNLITGEALWSGKQFEILGYPPAMGGRATRDMWRRRVHRDDLARVDAVFEQAEVERTTCTQEYRIVRADNGQTAWVSTSGEFQYDENGRAVKMIGVLFDCTDRKRAEEALRESEDRFRTLADHISQFAWMADENGDIFWYNKRWYEYTGTTPEEMRGWGWQKVHHPDHVDRVVAYIRHCFVNGETWEDRFPLRAADGSWRWFLSRARPIRDADGRICRWFGTNTDITEQMESEQRLKHALAETESALQALHVSEQRLRIAQQAAACGTWEWDPATDQLTCSQEYAALLGSSCDSLSTGSSWLALLLPLDRARVIQEWEAACVRDTELRTEFRVRRDGEIRWLLSAGRRCSERDGRILGVSIDITDRKRIEQQLADSHEIAVRRLQQIEAIYATAPVGLGFVDSDLRFVSVSERLAAMNGVPAADHIGRSIHEIIKDTAEAAEPFLRKVFESGQPLFDVEVRQSDASDPGHPRSWVSSYFPLKDSSGRVLGVNASVEEVTERRRIEQALRESEERYGLVARATKDAIWDRDLIADRIEWSEAVQALFGYHPGDIDAGGAWWRERIHPEDRVRVLGLFDAFVSKPPGENWKQEYRFRRADGSWAHVLDRGFLIWREGRAVRFVGSMVDVSHIREVEAQLRGANAALERSNEDLQRFAYAVSHDLKSPLRTIGAMVQLIERKHGHVLEENGKQVLSMVIAGVERMNKLITDLLEYSRVTSHVSQRPRCIECNEVFASAIMNLRQLIDETGASVTRESLPAVTGDDQLPSVFQNLIENGIKYRGEAAPAIHVSAEPRGDRWMISFRDNGIGFDMKYAERIFGVFQRLEHRGKSEGTGIGLAICKRVVERLGGRIWAESIPNAGSVFHLTLPAARQVTEEVESAADSAYG